MIRVTIYGDFMFQNKDIEQVAMDLALGISDMLHQYKRVDTVSSVEVKIKSKEIVKVEVIA